MTSAFRRRDAALLSGIVLLLIVALGRGIRAVNAAREGERPATAARSSIVRFTREDFRLFETQIARHAPFRLSTEAPSVRYGESPREAEIPPPAPARLPSLAVRAIVGGPPWQALIEGLPGSQGATVVRIGDVYAGLTVRRIDSARVVLRGLDSTWVLALPARGEP